MLKSIPKSNISRRSFKVYKRFTADQSDYPVIKAYSESGIFDSETFTKDEGVYVHLIYKSIQKKYYTDNGLLNNYGTIPADSNFVADREFGNTIYIIKINQSKFGEKIKPGSLSITDTDKNVTYFDSGAGRIISSSPSYVITSLDIENQTLILSIDGSPITLTVTSIDLQTGAAVLTYGSSTDTEYLVSIDFENGLVIFTAEITIGNFRVNRQDYGNIFYSDGLIVFTELEDDIDNYEIEYRATQTIHETEILLEANSGEFNFSQNPSAVNVTLSGSYDFTTTAITNVSPAKTVKIKEVLDISQRTSYSGSYGSTTGSWDDYDNYKLTDPTGSYLAPFVSTIGIYDNDGDMVAIAKLPQPIKNLSDYDVNFIVRFDT